MSGNQHQNEIINQQAFFGGTSFDKKIGTENSMQYLRGFDWRKNPSELVQAMQARQIDSGNLDGLPPTCKLGWVGYHKPKHLRKLP